MMMLRLIAIIPVLILALASIARAEPAPDINLGYFNKLAMNGYDVMTYWNGGDPKKGDPDIQAAYKGATWVFISDENRAAFMADPAHFAPQYGGYCAYAASRNAVADVDPFAWRIWNDKLYLNYSLRVRREWASDIDDNISKAGGFWPALLENQ